MLPRPNQIPSYEIEIAFECTDASSCHACGSDKVRTEVDATLRIEQGESAEWIDLGTVPLCWNCALVVDDVAKTFGKPAALAMLRASGLVEFDGDARQYTRILRGMLFG